MISDLNIYIPMALNGSVGVNMYEIGSQLVKILKRNYKCDKRAIKFQLMVQKAYPSHFSGPILPTRHKDQFELSELRLLCNLGREHIEAINKG